MKRLAFLVMCLCIGACGVAYAADAVPDSPQSLAALWPMLGLAIANVAAYGTRKLSAQYTFFHTGLGAIALGVIGAAITAGSSRLSAGQFTWAALAWAAVGGASSFIATLNPSATKDDPPAKSPAARPLVMPTPPGGQS